MSGKRALMAAALLSLFAGATHAQNEANPQSQPPSQQSGRGMMGDEQMMGPSGGGGQMDMVPEQQAAKNRGIIGIVPVLRADTVGASARLVVRSVEPYSPAYYAGIESGDQIVQVDGQPIDGKGLSEVATAIRGEVGTAVKLCLSRQGQTREISLTRVAPVSERHEHQMSAHRHMGEGGGMNMMDH